MKIRLLFVICLFFISFLSCKKPDPTYECQLHTQKKFINHHDALQAFPSDVFNLLYSSKGPNSDGALGRNKEGYFHVRFQMDMLFVASYAAKNQNLIALDEFIKSIEYSFDHQLANGNFELSVPSSLNELPNASESDSASGVAFFMASLGNSLLTSVNNNWFLTLSDTTFKNRIDILKPKIQLSLNWLKTKENILLQADALAPNRLFFDALAFYTLGSFLGDSNAKNMGISFINKGILMQHSKGYFKELDGWDSSYQGVALLNGFYLILAINNNESIHSQLWQSISCGTDWQKSRILKSGEISLKDNTRVYKGGEDFLGKEKEIAWLDTYFSFLLMNYLSENSEFNESAKNVRKFYE